VGQVSFSSKALGIATSIQLPNLAVLSTDESFQDGIGDNHSQKSEKLDSRFIAVQSLLKNCIDCIVFPYVVCDRKDAGMTQSTVEWLTLIGDVSKHALSQPLGRSQRKAKSCRLFLGVLDLWQDVLCKAVCSQKN
jgi:hypothetical protein